MIESFRVRMANSTAEFHLSEVPISSDLLDRVQFSVSSRNAESAVCETVAHIFGSRMVESPTSIDWKHITSGIIAVLRNKEPGKKRYVWALNLCIYNVDHGVLVWKGRIPMNCQYTVIADNFHVLSLQNDEGILGLLFQSPDAAGVFHETLSSWISEGMRDEKGKAAQPAPSVKFRKEMISKPCNFQHIQGSQAIEQCIEIEKIKGDILTSLESLKSKSEIDGGKPRRKPHRNKKSKEPPRPHLRFSQLGMPAASIEKGSDDLESPAGSETQLTIPESPANGGGAQAYSFHSPPTLGHSMQVGQSQSANTNELGSDSSQSSLFTPPGRLSPLNLIDEINASFAISSTLSPTALSWETNTT